MDDIGVWLKIIGLLLGVLTFYTGLLAIPVKFLLGRYTAFNDRNAKLMDKSIHNLGNQIEATGLRIEQIKEQMARAQAQLPMNYVAREDWIRRESIIDAKMDKINEKLDLIKHA